MAGAPRTRALAACKAQVACGGIIVGLQQRGPRGVRGWERRGRWGGWWMDGEGIKGFLEGLQALGSLSHGYSVLGCWQCMVHGQRDWRVVVARSMAWSLPIPCLLLALRAINTNTHVTCGAGNSRAQPWQGAWRTKTRGSGGDTVRGNGAACRANRRTVLDPVGPAGPKGRAAAVSRGAVTVGWQ